MEYEGSEKMNIPDTFRIIHKRSVGKVYMKEQTKMIFDKSRDFITANMLLIISKEDVVCDTAHSLVSSYIM